MNSLWWLALPVVLLPVWWHRQKREQTRARPLATARFAPRAQPNQVRVWRWSDLFLLLVRCLLLASVVAWLADPVLPWRGDTVLMAQGTDNKWAARQIADAGFEGATRETLPAPELLGWLRSHEREWPAGARLLVLGDIPMPAEMPRFAHKVELRTLASPLQGAEHHVAIVSEREQEWLRLFAALDGGRRYVIDAAPGPRTELIVWDNAQAPAGGMRAPLWWVADATAFPELRNAGEVDGLRYADSPRGRLWQAQAWPPQDAGAARALFEAWQRLHYAPVPYTLPSQVISASGQWAEEEAEGALRDKLLAAIVALFALERVLSHARRR
jgi:hypothetical protein